MVQMLLTKGTSAESQSLLFRQRPSTFLATVPVRTRGGKIFVSGRFRQIEDSTQRTLFLLSTAPRRQTSKRYSA